MFKDKYKRISCMLLFFLIVGRTMAQQPLTFELERVSDSLSWLCLCSKTESKIVDQNFTINTINKANTYFPMITGDNQIVSIKDDFFDLADIDLLNKHIPSTTQSATVSSHASAMATIVSGIGNS